MTNCKIVAMEFVSSIIFVHSKKVCENNKFTAFLSLFYYDLTIVFDKE